MKEQPFTLSHNRKRAMLPLLSLFITLSVSAHAEAQVAAARAGEEVNRATAPAAPGSITGRVVGEDGRPMVEAQVIIYGAYQSANSRAAITDSSGLFQFKDLPPRPYIMRVALPGYVEAPDETRSLWEPRYVFVGDRVQLTLVRGGVITGTVLNAQGEPIVGTVVRAIRVRDAQGHRTAPDVVPVAMPRMTDDRGIYRIYGLQPGSYIVVTAGNTPFFGMANSFEGEMPTYYPSSTRDTAMEVAVRSGEESTGVDIRYRNERGRVISGIVTGTTNATEHFSISLILTRVGSGVVEAQTFAPDAGDRRAFSLTGVADGEYELVAQGFLERGESVASAPMRVTVRGSDLTGLQLSLAPLASLSGRITLDPPLTDPSCTSVNSAATLTSSFVFARREDFERERLQPPILSASGNSPNEQGEFTLRNLSAGIFRLTLRLPNDNLYVRALTLPQAVNTGAQASGARATPSGTIAVRSGERASGITINLSQGAANLGGRVAPQAEGVALPPNLRAYLVPTERERADDVLRYAEANVASDGSFTFKSLAPGRYWIIVRPAPETDALQMPRMLAWDGETRKALRRDAEAGGSAIELKQCQRVTDYQISYAAK